MSDPSTRRIELTAEALALREFQASIIEATDPGTHAIEYAMHGWAVFPLRGKAPAIGNPHPKGSRERETCKGECGLNGHGVLDASTDIEAVIAWWSGRYAGCNIGGRVPESMFVLDLDPRKNGLESLAALRHRYGALPDTLTTLTGRGDGGWHRFYRRPPGKLSAANLGPGIDIKTSAGYVVLPPSIHPDTGKPYVRVDAPVAAPPPWLVRLLRPETQNTQHTQHTQLRGDYHGESIADAFCAEHTWSDVLTPHRWTSTSREPNADGAKWCHPTHTSEWSATIRHGCLFVYSPNTPFDVTEQSDPHGYTRFRAYAVLEHGGDLRAAAKHLAQTRRGAA
ncbi:MAG TPA: bifunctional DNA primase/polymerase [Mycobacterium sp.]|uniref:bifunctional DNA primase/polymerase n=1 Tax=Mycobacterium sp. TaxID=1785 RepID=UPI002B941D61|nr:bifunctional DNA primase/polymerase [Mycobacterium sp.]HME78912.1 bifunctional DNA primase/polymerase [Mycobacterium sp.]